MEDTGWLYGYIQPDDFLIAADGGNQFLHALGKKPDVLIGDLDSISEVQLHDLRNFGVEINQHPEDKDLTDLELALNYSVQKGFSTIRIIAALGGRLDQTLGNIFLLTSPSLKGLDVRIENGGEQVMLISSHTIIQGSRGDRVSLLPIGGSADNIHTIGLKYPLDNESLYPDHTRGISNVMLDSRAEIRVGKGNLLCIHTRLQ